MSNQLFYHFAGLTCKISGPSRHIKYIEKCYNKSPFRLFLFDSSIKHSVDAYLYIVILKTPTLKDYFELTSQPKKNQFFLECSENLFFLIPVIEQVLRKIFYTLFFKNRGFILHASAVVFNNEAFIFTGESGAGKSTIVTKLREENAAIQIIADNNVYIKREQKSFYLYPPAFLEWNLSSKIFPDNRKYQVRKFFFLKIATHISVKNVSFLPAFQRIYKQIQIPRGHLTKSEIAGTPRNILEFTKHLANKNAIFTFAFSLHDKLTHQHLINS